MKNALIVASVASVIQQFNMNNIKLLQELGYNVTVACNLENGSTCSNSKIEEMKNIFKEKNIECIHIDFPRNPFSFKLLKSYKQIKNVIKSKQYNLIHCHTPVGGLITRLVAKNTNTTSNRKVIYTAHGFHFFKGAPILNWLLFYPIEKYLSKYTDTLITINKEDYELAKNKFKIKDIQLIQGVGVDKNKFNNKLLDIQKKDIRNSLNISNDDFLIICVAELNKNKNQELIIKAMNEIAKKSDKYKLILVGKDMLSGYHQKLINNYNLNNYIQLLGYRSDIPELLNISDLLISCSKREGLPVNLIEALMSNTPVIATNCRGNRDLIDDNYLVEIDDYISLKDAILSIDRDKYIFETSQYEKDVIIKKYEEIYK